MKVVKLCKFALNQNVSTVCVVVSLTCGFARGLEDFVVNQKAKPTAALIATRRRKGSRRTNGAQNGAQNGAECRRSLS